MHLLPLIEEFAREPLPDLALDLTPAEQDAAVQGFVRLVKREAMELLAEAATGPSEDPLPEAVIGG